MMDDEELLELVELETREMPLGPPKGRSQDVL